MYILNSEHIFFLYAGNSNSTHSLSNYSNMQRNATCAAWPQQRGLNFPQISFPCLNVHGGFLPMAERLYKAGGPMSMSGTVSLFQQGNTRDQPVNGINEQYTKAPLGGSSRLKSKQCPKAAAVHSQSQCSLTSTAFRVAAIKS